MMNRASRFLLGLAVGVLSFALADDAAAQTEWMYGISYGVAQPLSDTKDYTDSFSFRNADAELRGMMGKVSLGLSVGWHVFDDEVETTTDLADQPLTVSGVQLRTVNTVPMLLTAHTYFGAAGQPRAYAGVGAGVVYTETRVDIGLLALDQDSWDFGVVPELGFLAPMGSLTDFYLSAKYQWTSGDFDAQALYFNIGFMSRPF